MTNAQLLITARLVHQEAARIFAEVATRYDANGAAYQVAAQRLERAALDLAAVTAIVNSQTIYLPDETIRPRLEAWTPADDEGWSDPDSADPDDQPPAPAAVQE